MCGDQTPQNVDPIHLSALHRADQAHPPASLSHGSVASRSQHQAPKCEDMPQPSEAETEC